MNIKPVKNYKKPNYAKGLAVTLATVTTLSGCEDPFAVDGTAPVPDIRTSEVNIDGGIAVPEDLVIPEGTIATEEDITDVALDGDVVFTDEYKSTTQKTPAVTISEQIDTNYTTISSNKTENLLSDKLILTENELCVSDGTLIDENFLYFDNLAYGIYSYRDDIEWFQIKKGATYGNLTVLEANSLYTDFSGNWLLEEQSICLEGSISLSGVLSYVPDGDSPEYQTQGHELFFLPDTQSFIQSDIPMLHSGVSYLPTINCNDSLSGTVPVFSLGLLSDYEELENLKNIEFCKLMPASITIENIKFTSGTKCRAIGNITSIKILD